jgi:hypothetical protein
MAPYKPNQEELEAAQVYHKYYAPDQEQHDGQRTRENYRHYIDQICKDGWKWGNLGWTKAPMLPGLEEPNVYRPYSTEE